MWTAARAWLCRGFGNKNQGMYSMRGQVESSRCRFENNRFDDEYVGGGEVKLVECAVRNNGWNGLCCCRSRRLVNPNQAANQATVATVVGATVVDGTINGNKAHDVIACGGSGKVVVSAAENSEEVDRKQTVSSGNGKHEWATQYGGVIEGLAVGR